MAGEHYIMAELSLRTGEAKKCFDPGQASHLYQFDQPLCPCGKGANKLCKPLHWDNLIQFRVELVWKESRIKLHSYKLHWSRCLSIAYPKAHRLLSGSLVSYDYVLQ